MIMKIWEVDLPKLDSTEVSDITGRRWILDVGLSYVDLTYQVKWKNNSWKYGGLYYTVAFTKKFSLGRKHMYCYGPNDSLSLGWLRFSWSTGSCKKCFKM